ncbi:stalk domain-containing protein [Thermoanaerobacter siderophilus]|uniref:Copper amine oxidase family protein n=1 Tax=Thermoanaerobacter siderophilus SR4 TaxID=880478 RepID=I9KSY0_9THEO|nr:stalk domain-containing protein [Thermoanaerobacter siderophilus]EIV99915.1 copper amine oxidase family protein [Thermoanaerobacter siderophilus SR4]
MKKIISAIIAVLLIFLSIPAFAQTGGQEEELPYQEWIDKGWIKAVSPDEKGHDKLGWYYIMPGKEKEIAYSDKLKNTDRLIVVAGSLYYDKPLEELVKIYKEQGFSDVCLYDLTTKIGYLDGYLANDYIGTVRYNHPDTFKVALWKQFTVGLITVNGVDWQKTPYKDVILQALYSRWEGLKDPAYNKYLIDPKWNGYTMECIYNWDGVDVWIGKDNITVRYELKENKGKLPTRVISDNGVAMIPLRGVMEELGAVVDYNAKTQQITIKDKGKTVVLKIGSDTAVVDGKAVKMPRKVYVKNGYTMLPLRFVAENLDHAVEYLNDGTIMIWRAKYTTPPRI